MNSNLQLEIKEKEQQLRNLKTSITRSEKDVLTFRKKAKELEDKYRANMRRLEGDQARKLDQVVQSAERSDRQAQQKAEHDLRDFDADIRSYEDQIKRAEREIRFAEDEMRRKINLDAHKEGGKVSTAQVDTQMRMNLSSDRKITSLRQRIDQLRVRLTDVTQLMRRKTAELKNMADNLATKNRSSIDNKKVEQNVEVEKLRKEHEKETVDHKELLARTEKELADKQTQYGELETELKKLQDDIKMQEQQRIAQKGAANDNKKDKKLAA